MASRRFDIVVSDIDGCLSPEGPLAFDAPRLAKIAAFNREAQARRDRPVVTVCSGRPLPFAEAMCRLIGNTSVPCVAENGVWVYHPGTNEYLMDPRITREHLQAVRAAAEWLREEFGPRGVTQQPGKSASISLYHPKTGVLHEIRDGIKAEFDRRGWPLRVSMTWLYINCDLEHVSKATGLDRLIDMVGATKDRLAGIGDTTSDLAIRRHVAWFGCPANAVEDLKPHADLVAAHDEVEGVLEILETIRRL
ncbi:MAG: HAD hydrolase family protein [Phycisphaeraceae bacterium]|nr:HAD hydrolase family protein [Phycisphaeraceae bacterium]